MNLREGILDSLADDGESILQIEQYLKYLNMDAERNEVVKLLKQLIAAKKIAIEYPQNTITIDENQIENYWFELTDEGRNEWDKIEVP